MEDGGKKRTLHVNGLRIATRCDTIEQFVDKFQRFCEDGAVFVPHAKRDVGAETAFSFDLTAGEPVLCGIGTVVDHFTTADNRFGRPGIVIGIKRLQADSQLILDNMLLARAIVHEQRAQREGSKRASTMLVTPSTPQPTVRELDRATPLPVRSARAMTSAVEIVDSVALKTAMLPATNLQHRPAPLAPVTMPTRLPGVAVSKLASASSALAPANEGLASDRHLEPKAAESGPSVPTPMPFAESSDALAVPVAATEPAEEPAVAARPLEVEDLPSGAERLAAISTAPMLAPRPAVAAAADASARLQVAAIPAVAAAADASARLQVAAIPAATDVVGVRGAASKRRRIRDGLLGAAVGGAIVLAIMLVLWPHTRNAPAPSRAASPSTAPIPATATAPLATPPTTVPTTPPATDPAPPPTTTDTQDPAPAVTKGPTPTSPIAKKQPIAKKKPIAKKSVAKKPAAKAKAHCASPSCM